MKPAFSKITIKKASGTLTVAGPIDLDGTEIDAYFWVRVVKKDESAEAIGSDEMSKRKLGSALQTAVKAGVAASAPPDPMWTATIPIEKGTFAKGDLVDIEAWAKVSADHKLMFTVYWQQEDFTIR
jgi:hypothetical protein